MPSATIHSALTEMYLEEESPWQFSEWKKITGVNHGLFPTDDALLPKGWTRETATLIESYFSQFENQGTAEAKIQFASARRGAITVPGRNLWRAWVTACWREWRIHAKITDVLSSQNLHPLTISLNSKSKSLSWPKAGTYVALTIDAVGQMLFGEDVLDMFGRLPEEMRSDVNALVTRTWFYLRIQFDRNKTRVVNLEKQATEAFESLNKAKPTKVKIMAVLVKVSRWRALALVLRSKENEDKIESMDAALRELMNGLGANLSEATSKKPRNKYIKVTAEALKALASEEDVADIVSLYTEFFAGPDPRDSVDLQEQVPDVSFRFGEGVNGTDPGVEMEMSLTPDQLNVNLGWINGRSFFFNHHRHRAGLSAWDPANAHLYGATYAAACEDMDELTLHWHQRVGVHSMVRMIFKPNPDPKALTGVLVADEVGLGKSFQAVGLIAFLSEAVVRQEMKAKPAPLIEQNPYLGASDTVPDLPHLILVPGTLVAQWETEMKALLRPKSFDIIKYETGKGAHKTFWTPEGAFMTSKQKPRQKIILASHSAFHLDAATLFVWAKPSPGQLPWAPARRLPTYDQRVDNTLWGQEYLSITLDEGHLYRNCGARHCHVVNLMLRARVRVVLTATPVQTSTKDIAGMGRLIGIPYFSSDAAFVEEKSDASTVRRSKGIDPDAPIDQASVNCLVLIARRMQRQFEGRVLRRTIDSLDWRGQRVIDIPPFEEITVVLKLTTREMDIISELADSVKESISASNAELQIVSRGFYLEHRMSVGFARKDLTQVAPVFKTLEAWDAMKSTKFDTFARMVRHLQTRDDAPPMVFEGGKVIYPDMPPLAPGQTISQKNKFIGYLEFVSLAPLLRNVLDLYEINYVYIDGQTSFLQRASIVKQFCEGFTHRLIIISSVGAVGLNLSVASTILFIDQPWSAQDERQIRGRAHRQPQKKIVKCYHLLADETADIVLASLARGKKTMFDAFLEKESGQEMYQLLSGKHVGQPDDGCDDEDDFEVTDAKRIAKRDEKIERKKVKEAEKASAELNGEDQPEHDHNGDDGVRGVGAEQLTKEEKKAKKALAKEKENTPPIADEPTGDIEVKEMKQTREPSPAPMDVDTEQLHPAQPAQPQLMDVDDEDEESEANRDHATLLPGNGFNGDESDGDGFNGTASAPPTDDEPSGPNSDEENPSEDEEYNDSNGASKPLVNQLFSPDLRFLHPSSVKSPAAGDRRRRGPLPDSPENLKDTKRPRTVASEIVGSLSLPADYLDPEEIHPQDLLDLDDAVKEAITRGGSLSDDIDSFQTQPAINLRKPPLERPMVIRRRPVPAGFMCDPAAPPFAAPPKEPPREKAPPGRNLMRPTSIQATHRRNTVTASDRDKFTQDMIAVNLKFDDEEFENSQGSGNSNPNSVLAAGFTLKPSARPVKPPTHGRGSSTSTLPKIRQPLKFGGAPGVSRGVSPPSASAQSRNPFSSARKQKRDW